MIGILGGTFDPVHYGHLKTAFEIKQSMGLERLIFVPAATPPHRSPPVASIEHRINMLKLVIPMYEGFELDDRERRLGGLSYTVRTLESFRKELSEESIGLIIGADAFAGFESWHEWQRIPELAHLVVMSRPMSHSGISESELPKWVQRRVVRESAETLDQLKACPAGLILFKTVTPVEISATAVRQAVSKGESVEELLPPVVLNYIEANKIYNV